MTNGYSRLVMLTYLSQRLEMTTFEMAIYFFPMDLFFPDRLLLNLNEKEKLITWKK